MKFNIKEWDDSVEFKDGLRSWNSFAENCKVLKITEYSKYSSVNFLYNIIDHLVRVCNSDEISFRFEGNNSNADTVGSRNIKLISDVLNEAGWGVMVVVSGRHVLSSVDLIDAFRLLGRNDFAIYLDFDAGLVAAVHIKKTEN